MSFVFERYGVHPYLHVLTHAFPTRRPSDLLVKGEHRRDAQEHRCRQGEVVLGAGSRAPAVICGARGGPENAAAFGGAETPAVGDGEERSEEHTSELQSLMRTSYAVSFLQKKKNYHLYDSSLDDNG